MLNTGNSSAPPPVDSSSADPAVTCLDARLVHGIRLNKEKERFYFIYNIVIKEELLATYGEEVRGAETTAAYQKTEQQPGNRRFYLNSVSLPLLMGNSDPV